MNFSSDKLSLMYLSIAPALPNVSEEKTRQEMKNNKNKSLEPQTHGILSSRAGAEGQKQSLIPII